MSTDKRKLGEMAFWIVLMVICVGISVFYMIQDNASDNFIPEATEAITETPVTDQTQEMQEVPDLPSGVIE